MVSLPLLPPSGPCICMYLHEVVICISVWTIRAECLHVPLHTAATRLKPLPSPWATAVRRVRTLRTGKHHVVYERHKWRFAYSVSLSQYAQTDHHGFSHPASRNKAQSVKQKQEKSYRSKHSFLEPAIDSPTPPSTLTTTTIIIITKRVNPYSACLTLLELPITPCKAKCTLHVALAHAHTTPFPFNKSPVISDKLSLSVNDNEPHPPALKSFSANCDF
jgi:hypothetical protein